MQVGTKSLLFGAHQFLLHPITVTIAWVELYGKFPNAKELLCIFVHDIGYLGKETMDGTDGKLHPEAGALIAWLFLGPNYADLVLFHSRHLAKKYKHPPSKLCLPDKLSLVYYPNWLYLSLTKITGELREYMQEAIANPTTPITEQNSPEEWLEWLKSRMRRLAKKGCNGGHKQT